MKTLAILSFVSLLAGCAFNVTLMPRDSGTMYSGDLVSSSGNGAGTMTVALEGTSCTGPAARVASNQSFGFASTYGSNNHGRTFNAFTTVATDGDVQLKAILSCSNGKGLRCDITGSNGSGGGICVDDAGKVYDALVIRK